MSLPITTRRKSTSCVAIGKQKFTTKNNETMNTIKKSDAPASIHTHRKSDAYKPVYIDTPEKSK